jgi:hypothetical protein
MTVMVNGCWVPIGVEIQQGTAEDKLIRIEVLR